jgi:hypothetical protein
MTRIREEAKFPMNATAQREDGEVLILHLPFGE